MRGSFLQTIAEVHLLNIGSSNRKIQVLVKNWLYTGICVLILKLVYLPPGFTQVVNNSIEHRAVLILDQEPTHSATNYSTVEWACINKSLTNKCLKYHNDQWFKFNVPTPGKYYLNIHSQRCRDARGVQAIVIEGNPCEIQTYKILKCISQIRQWDVFIELDSIKSNIDYLINIDGFLEDYCSFDIQLSTKPRGLEFYAKSLETIEVSEISSNIVALGWNISQASSPGLREFEIYRKHQNLAQSNLLGKVPIEINSVGIAKSSYNFTDTLKTEGTYTYEILGNFKDGLKQILSEQTIKYHKDFNSNEARIQFSLNYKNGTPIQMVLLDKLRDQVLKQTTFQFSKKDINQQIDVRHYLDLGINNFVVRIINLKTHEKKDHEFLLTNANR